MDLDRESLGWVEAGIITPEQRDKILARHPVEKKDEKPGVSLAVLAILWVGGALVFLGVAFLLSIVWEDLGHARDAIVFAIDAAFFGAGAFLLRARSSLEKTGLALLVIGGLLFPGAVGISYSDLFGSSDHYMGLIVLCGVVYAGLAFVLRSRAFSVLACTALFFVGVEVLRDQDRWGALIPLVRGGVVQRLDQVFPVVFLTLAAAPFGVSLLAGRDARFVHLRSTLFVLAYLLGLGPAVFGGLDRPYRGFNMTLGIGSALAAIVVSVLFRERRAFWLAGAALVGSLLVLFGVVFENSIAFTIFAIVVGLATMALGTYLSVKKSSLLDRLFAHELFGRPVPEDAGGEGSP